jgi:hypothetical protein
LIPSHSPANASRDNIHPSSLNLRSGSSLCQTVPCFLLYSTTCDSPCNLGPICKTPLPHQVSIHTGHQRTRTQVSRGDIFISINQSHSPHTTNMPLLPAPPESERSPLIPLIFQNHNPLGLIALLQEYRLKGSNLDLDDPFYKLTQAISGF